MDIFSIPMESLIKVIFIDLILSGDNAVVIAMAAKNVDKAHQKKAILFGTIGAIIMRILFALGIVYLMKIPYLMAIGGVLLIGIAYKLLSDNHSSNHKEGGTSVWSALRTIIWADAAMSLDNVLALAGVAHGNLSVILLGIIISIPIIIWGSAWIIKAMNKYSFIVYIGAGILAWTAGEMIVSDASLIAFSPWLSDTIWHYLVPIIITLLVVVMGIFKNKKEKPPVSL